MKQLGRRRVERTNINQPTTPTRLATSVPSYKISYHTDTTARKTEEHYVANATTTRSVPQGDIFDVPMEVAPEGPALPFLDVTEEAPGVVPAYETTKPCDEKGARKTRLNVAHMDELRAEEAAFIKILLLLHYDSKVLTPCVCGKASQVRKVGCSDCLQGELLCRQCWVNKHRLMPTHWALVWNEKDRFFERHKISRVIKNSVIGLGHHGERCEFADMARTFTLVDTNGIHATSIAFCRCKTVDGQRGAPEFQQLLAAGIFPGSVRDPKTGYTLGLLEYYRQLWSQGKGSAYNFVHVLRRMVDPFFMGSVPDVYINFIAITQFHQHLDILMKHGYAHEPDAALPGEVDRPYPNRPVGFISSHSTLDGNFKANLFFKRDDGSDTALTDGNMYFPRQAEFDAIAKAYVIPEEDKEVPCKAHIGSICHQGHVKYGNTASTCQGSLVDMPRGEAFAISTFAQREHLKHTNSPLPPPTATTPNVMSYDSYCSFVVNQAKRAIALFPEEKWLHQLLALVEGQIPADHINGHGVNCQTVWQAVYFACRAHFHGEPAKMLWAFLNPLGSLTRQMTGAARHDIMNFVLDAWNTWKVLRQAELLAAERQDALGLFELHMAVVADPNRQHASEVAGWSRLSRTTTKSAGGKLSSVYQHESTKVLTIESMLASMIAEERDKPTREEGEEARTSAAQWIHDGIQIERHELFLIALLGSHREHPLQDTWEVIKKLRDSLNLELKKFRERQREIYPRLTLSALDIDEPELTAVQLPSYRIKHRQRAATSDDANAHNSELRQAEIKLRCTQASSGILGVQGASVALSAVKQSRELDYQGQAGMTCSQRNLQRAELMKTFEITMYNRARGALIHLGHMAKDDVEPFPPMSARDTRRKDTHLHRAKGDSRLFDGTVWYLQSGVTISRGSLASMLSPNKRAPDSEDDEPQLLAGTQTLKRSGYKGSPRTAKRLKDIMPSDAVRAKGAKKSKTKAKKPDGWIWLDRVTRGQTLGDEGKLAEYKKESDRVQWFRTEAEMYRWLEQYERKHAEMMRVIARFQRDSTVWMGRAAREEGLGGGVNGGVAFARMQATMYRRLEHNAKVLFGSPDSGAHADWVSATSFDELVIKIDRWRDVVFKWMDDMGIRRAYKDF
ncbi:hypothetical protein B0H17DRAFT_1213768 [Mycena rosella]|uniref:CxC2-like cysteine cluster KDZ transposase-associated domain-containing protein n=1 Tax=Mycena rosella TaxID=1033263 RepID=A0AAD7CPI7_MYCRO|nr:hypothetical protein B0H17DRAFT_1213768 [Mycena rosella]